MSSLRSEDVSRPESSSAYVPTHRAEPLALVPDTDPVANAATPAVRTFAEAAEASKTWSRLRSVKHRTPAGQIHAAEQGARIALCGAPLSSLHEFDRGRYPFEQFPFAARCGACDEAAGRPRV
jgi:hypothetical protein